MIEWIRSCLARIGCLTLLVAGVMAGWMYQDDIAAWWEERAAAPARDEPSEALAARAERRLGRALEADGGGEVRLSPLEVESLVRYRVAPRLPRGVRRPSVTLGDSVVEVEASLDLARLLGDRIPDLVRRMVGDSARVTAVLRPRVPRPGRLRLRVEELRAGAVQVPSVMLPWLLGELALPTPESDPRAVELEVGLGLTAVRVDAGSLVLARSPGG